MNLPYILVDEFGIKDPANDLLISGIVKNIKDALSLPVLNYQYGYFDELTETLSQYSLTPEFEMIKFPLIWVEQPFTIDRDAPQIYGKTLDLRIFIIQQTAKDYKAVKRMSLVFKPVLYPIYLELLKQIQRCASFNNPYHVKHRVRDYYFWEDENNPKVSKLNDIVDCIQLSNVQIEILNKCYPGLT